MTAFVSPEVASRVRRAVPPGLGVLAGSLPVAAFGDPDRAVVATVSLNPSQREFLSRDGTWLEGDERRLASLVSLGAGDPRDLNDEQVMQVVAESNAYFRSPNWFKSWFHWLESLLRDCGAGSYLNGSACHLDLVQWATKPSQGGLQPGQWQRLVEADREFLRWQLANSHVNVVLVNGASVVRGLQDAKLISDWAQDDLRYKAANGSGKLSVFRAHVGGVLFLGWNRPLAGPIPAAGRTALTEWVTREMRSTTAAAESRGLPGPDHPAGHASDGFIPAGTVTQSAAELESLLDTWLRSSGQHTIGEVRTFGGAPLITVRTPVWEFVLNRDTKRAAVAAFLSAARTAGGAGRLPWHVAPNARGVANRMSYRPGDIPTPGWYAYLRAPRTPAGAAR